MGHEAFGVRCLSAVLCRRRLALLLVTLCAPAVLHAKDPLIRHFRAGALLTANIDAEFSVGGTFPVSGSAPGANGVSGVNHEYDDGFVRVDDTGNAGGFTSYWGYNNASQYDGGSTLTFTSTESYSLAGGTANANSDPHFGLDLAYGGTIKKIGKTWLSWEMGFSWLPMRIEDGTSYAATLAQNRYTFNTGSIVVPGAPYSGSSSGLGPAISDMAAAAGSQVSPGTVTGSREIESTLYNLRLGPHFHWDLTRHWALEAMGGVALGLVDGRYSYNEVLNSSTGTTVSSGDFDQSEWLWGGYAGLLTQVHLEKNSYVYVSAQFMTLGNVEFSAPGRSARLDLSQGVYVSAGFTWLF